MFDKTSNWEISDSMSKVLGIKPGASTFAGFKDWPPKLGRLVRINILKENLIPYE